MLVEHVSVCPWIILVPQATVYYNGFITTVCDGKFTFPKAGSYMCQ